MNRPSAYLAGPISGLDFTGATDWRLFAKDRLAECGIDGFSPMRAKAHLAGIQSFTKDCVDYAGNALSAPRGIMTRDFFDATRCDVLLVNLLGAKSVSIGTVMEMSWAYQCRTPIVCAIEDDRSNIHEHAMINEALGYRVPDINQAIDIVCAILKA